MSISGISSGGSNRPDFSQIQQSIFDQADSNGDGSIDSSEFDSMIQNSPRLDKALSSIVTNPDGSKATPDQIFKAVDTDGDGKISVDELKGAMKTAHSKMHGHHGGPPPVSDDSSSDDSSDTSTSGISNTVNQIFQLLDTDGDGQVSSTELSAAMSNLSAANGTTGTASSSDSASSSSSSSSTSSSDSGSSTSSTTSGTTAVSSQTASLQALLQQLMVQIQQQQAAYTQNGSSTEAGAMPSFFKVTA